MIIRICNLRDKKADFKCDRSSPLGNPYYITTSQNRDCVCNLYEKYFYETILNPDKSPPGALQYLDEILQYCKTTDFDEVTLGCWCYPNRCHTQTIKEWLEMELK